MAWNRPADMPRAEPRPMTVITYPTWEMEWKASSRLKLCWLKAMVTHTNMLMTPMPVTKYCTKV